MCECALQCNWYITAIRKSAILDVFLGCNSSSTAANCMLVFQGKKCLTSSIILSVTGIKWVLHLSILNTPLEKYFTVLNWSSLIYLYHDKLHFWSKYKYLRDGWPLVPLVPPSYQCFSSADLIHEMMWWLYFNMSTKWLSIVPMHKSQCSLSANKFVRFLYDTYFITRLMEVFWILSRNTAPRIAAELRAHNKLIFNKMLK